MSRVQSLKIPADLSHQVVDRAEATGFFDEGVLQVGFICLFVARQLLTCVRSAKLSHVPEVR